ncbi:MAG: hypothetical protein R6U88_03250, partial [Candidatus Bipolaricaulota bacterium]
GGLHESVHGVTARRFLLTTLLPVLIVACTAAVAFSTYPDLRPWVFPALFMYVAGMWPVFPLCWRLLRTSPRGLVFWWASTEAALFEPHG